MSARKRPMLVARTIVGEATAWLPNHANPDHLASDDPNEVVRGLAFTGPESQMQSVGWTLIGKASITVEVPDMNGLVEAKIDTLKKQQKSVLAEAQAKSTELEGQIQKLLAITFEPAEVSL